MKKRLLVAILALACTDCLLAKTYHLANDSDHRHVFKKYIDYSKVYFQDSHFRFRDSQGKTVLLKSLRADDGGVFYYQKDFVRKK